jgi:hypothetical protein
MKQPTRLGLLRIVATLEIIMFIYVMSFVLRKVLFGNNGGLISFAIFYMSAAAGFIVGSFIFKDSSSLVIKLTETSVMKFLTYILNMDKKTVFTAKLVSALTTLLPAIAVIILFRTQGFLGIIFEVIFIVLPYRVAINSSKKYYQDIIVNGVIYFGFFVLAASLIASSFYHPLNNIKTPIYFILYAYILIYLILKNQEDIDDNIYSKKYIQKSILPKNMRSFNTTAVLILFTIIILLFNFKALIASVIKYLAILSAKFVLLVLWLLSFIFPQSANQQQGQQNQDMQLPKADAANNNQLLDIILKVIIAAIVIFILYKLIPVLFRKLSELFLRLIVFLRKVFQVQKADGGIVGDYDDETETVRPEKGLASKRAEKFRKKVSDKEMKGIKDPVERVRYIYMLLLRMLEHAGIGREKSDTANEIYNKSTHIANVSDPLLKITNIYEKVRYGEYIPKSEDINDIDRKYEQAAGYILKK